MRKIEKIIRDLKKCLEEHSTGIPNEWYNTFPKSNAHWMLSLYLLSILLGSSTYDKELIITYKEIKRILAIFRIKDTKRSLKYLENFGCVKRYFVKEEKNKGIMVIKIYFERIEEISGDWK